MYLSFNISVTLNVQNKGHVRYLGFVTFILVTFLMNTIDVQLFVSIKQLPVKSDSKLTAKKLYSDTIQRSKDELTSLHAFTSLLVLLPRFGIVWSTRPGAAMNSRSSHVVTSPTFLEFPQNHSATKLYISSQIFWQITRYLVLLNNDYTSRNIGFGRRQNQTQWPPWLP